MQSQGMTIPLLEVSCDGVFEYGQAYVALSRAVDMEGLTLLNFSPDKVSWLVTSLVVYVYQYC